jgi:hypothetical protein
MNGPRSCVDRVDQENITECIRMAVIVIPER